MQRQDRIRREALAQVFGAVYQSSPLVMQDYGVPGRELMHFNDQLALEQFICSEMTGGRVSANFALHYPDTGGLAVQERIDLNSPAANGAAWRYAVRGWGLIQLQLEFRDSAAVGCRIAVNSAERASAWAATYPQLGEPSLWNWPLVERHARRLIRVLRKCAGPT